MLNSSVPISFLSQMILLFPRDLFSCTMELEISSRKMRFYLCKKWGNAMLDVSFKWRKEC